MKPSSLPLNATKIASLPTFSTVTSSFWPTRGADADWEYVR
ncbi:MAG: hypothetical protein U0165_17390 [Polyangiaceae bacterium]